MQGDSSESLRAYKAVNPNSDLGDYLFYVMKFHEMPTDFVPTLLEWATPTFLIHDNLLFIDRLFHESRYQELVAQHGKDTAQFWMNNTELVGQFDFLSYPQINQIAHILARIWNALIQAEYPDRNERARLCHDDEFDEIHIVVDCK